jgi:hypothetical protein
VNTQGSGQAEIGVETAPGVGRGPDAERPGLGQQRLDDGQAAVQIGGLAAGLGGLEGVEEGGAALHQASILGPGSAAGRGFRGLWSTFVGLAVTIDPHWD